VKRVLLGSFAVLTLSAISVFFLPGETHLEFYDVRDLVYDIGGGFPEVDISLATDPPIPAAFEPEPSIGPEMADFLQSVIPGSSGGSDDRVIAFQNRILVVRAGVPQQVTVRAYLAAYRAKNNSMRSLGRSIVSSRAWLSRAWPALRFR